VDVGSVANVSGVHAASIFVIQVSRIRVHVYIEFSLTKPEGSVKDWRQITATRDAYQGNFVKNF
jgi:hypothetical protein